MSEDNPTIEANGFDGFIHIPTDLPAGTVIMVTITIGPRVEAQAQAQALPPTVEAARRYVGARAINGGGA